MKKILISLIILFTISFSSLSVNAVILGNRGYTTSWETISRISHNTPAESIRCIAFQTYTDGYIEYISVYLKRINNNDNVTCAIYDSTGILDTTEELLITTTTGQLYNFYFDSPIHIYANEGYLISVFADCSLTSGESLNILQISYASINSINYYYENTYSYDTFPNYISDYTLGSNRYYCISFSFIPEIIPTVNLYQNIENITTFTHEYNIDSLDVNVWFNGSGDVTPIQLYNNFVNCTGTHEYNLDSIGYNVYANVTGNASSYFDGNSSDIWLYTGDTITFSPVLVLLSYLFTLLYFVFSSKTNSMFISTGSHYIFMFFTIILLLGIEVGHFVTDLGLTELERVMLSPFLLVFIALLWLMRPVKK